MSDNNDAVILRDLVYSILFGSVMHFNDEQREGDKRANEIANRIYRYFEWVREQRGTT